jgi:hypothetical protein
LDYKKGVNSSKVDDALKKLNSQYFTVFKQHQTKINKEKQEAAKEQGVPKIRMNAVSEINTQIIQPYRKILANLNDLDIIIHESLRDKEIFKSLNDNTWASLFVLPENMLTFLENNSFRYSNNINSVLSSFVKSLVDLDDKFSYFVQTVVDFAHEDFKLLNDIKNIKDEKAIFKKIVDYTKRVSKKEIKRPKSFTKLITNLDLRVLTTFKSKFDRIPEFVLPYLLNWKRNIFKNMVIEPLDLSLTDFKTSINLVSTELSSIKSLGIIKPDITETK